MVTSLVLLLGMVTGAPAQMAPEPAAAHAAPPTPALTVTVHTGPPTPASNTSSGEIVDPFAVAGPRVAVAVRASDDLRDPFAPAALAARVKNPIRGPLASPFAGPSPGQSRAARGLPLTAPTRSELQDPFAT